MMQMYEITAEEKERELRTIIARSALRPSSLPAVVVKHIRELGLRTLFWDMAQSLLIAVLSLLVVALLLMIAMPTMLLVILTFAFAPLLFLVIQFSTELIERTDSLYELKLTCRYTIRQITALRVLCFSLLGSVFCIGMTLYLAQSATQTLHLLSLALSGLFFFALLSLMLPRFLPFVLAHLLVGGVWVAATFVPLLIFGESWELMLAGSPILLTLGVALLSIALFLREVKKLLLDGLPGGSLGGSPGGLPGGLTGGSLDGEDIAHAYGRSGH